MVVNIFKVLIPLALAVIIGLFFSLGLHKKGPWGSIGTFILILFLAIWAATLWINPVGPTAWGIPWFPVVFFGLIFGLILAQITPTPKDKFKGRKKMFSLEEESSKKTQRAIAVDEIFWILVIAFIIAIIVGYM